MNFVGNNGESEHKRVFKLVWTYERRRVQRVIP